MAAVLMREDIGPGAIMPGVVAAMEVLAVGSRAVATIVARKAVCGQ